MPPILTRADSLREYLTGALSDGGAQSNPLLSLGNYRSSTEAVSLGIQIAGAIPGVSILYASGANPIGVGLLTAVDPNNLVWTPNGGQPGSPTSFPNGVLTPAIVEGSLPGQYLRVTGQAPFVIGTSEITLSYIFNNVFAMDNPTASQAAGGEDQYLATILRNEAGFPISSWQRWLSNLGTPQLSDGGVLPNLGGSGTLITLSGNFNDWPSAGWCQIFNNFSSTIREVVYYNSRTSTTLNVPATGRGLFATSPTGGLTTDSIIPVPGVAIGLDPNGIQSSGSPIQTTPNINTDPGGITWVLGANNNNGLSVGNLNPGQQIGIWIWREIPPGAVSSALNLTQFQESFNAF